MNHEEIDRELGEALDSLRDVPLPDEGRAAAQHAAFLAGAREQRRLAKSPEGPERRWGFMRSAPTFSRRWAVAGVITALVLALLLSSGGVIGSLNVTFSSLPSLMSPGATWRVMPWSMVATSGRVL